MAGPIYQNHSPGYNAQGILPSAPVYFETRSPGIGVVKNSINVVIDTQNAIINGQFQTGYSGVIQTVIDGFNVYINHTTNFTEGSTVSVHINATDFNNDATSDAYSFAIVLNDVIAPSTIARPRGGHYKSTQNVELIANETAVTRYTVDGSTPNISSDIYTTPIVITNNTTLKFFSIDNNNNIEGIQVEVYEIEEVIDDTDAPITTANPVGGSYQNLTSVTLTSSEAATIYYSLDGNDPDPENSLDNTFKDTSPVIVEFPSNSTYEIRFFAIDPHGNRESTIKSEIYAIESDENNLVPTNVFVVYPYIKNTIDVCWDDMIPINGDIIGYNVYRSQSDVGEFEKLNNELIQSTFFRDQTFDKRVVSENVSDQFSSSTPTTTDFEGEIVCTCQWEAIDNHQMFYQSDGIFFEDVFGGSREAVLQSKFKFKEDFDFESNFELINWPITDVNLIQNTSLIVAFNDSTFIRVSRERRNATDYYVSSLFVNSSEVSRNEVLTADTRGTIKIIRVGSDVSTYYYDGTNFILLDSYLSFSEDELQVKYYTKSADKQIKVYWENFKINVGEINTQIKTPDGDYCIQLQHKPITSKINIGQTTNLINDVEVTIDGRIALIKSVDGIRGTIILNTERKYDYVLDKWIEPVIPSSNSIVTVTYQYNINFVRLQLRNTYYYKITAILNDNTETRLSLCTPETVKADKIDWTYNEAIRRNKWLLDQTGERVLLFIRKTAGVKCECFERNEDTHAQPKVGSCKECWGTGFVGGYDGPYEIKIGPLQTEQKIALTDRGLKLDNTQDSWTTVTPILNQRDFIVRRSAMIYGIGPVSRPEVRGVAVQQHFQIGYFDTTDIRYEFVESLNLFNYSEKIGLRGPFVHHSEDQGIVDGNIVEKDKLRTNKSTEFDNEKGRNLVFENTTF